MELSFSPDTTAAWIINYVLLFVFIFVAALVFRDATKQQRTAPSALLWALFSLFTFPIGALIYFFFGRNKNGQSPASS